MTLIALPTDKQKTKVIEKLVIGQRNLKKNNSAAGVINKYLY